MALHLRPIPPLAMNPCLSEVDYSRQDFNRDPQKKRHPLWITASQIRYHLYREHETGELYCLKSPTGGYLRSPRTLLGMAAYRCIVDPKIWRSVSADTLPGELFIILLTEAFQWKEVHAICHLIANWPLYYLRIFDVIPLEENVSGSYLTSPLEGPGSTTLLDWLIISFLHQKPGGHLKVVDMTGFEHDWRLCSELARLPILWITPGERKADWLINAVRPLVRASKEKLARYITRISFMYSIMDHEFPHGKDFGPIQIFMDVKVMTDDVALGLALQFLSPFRFSCNRLWMDHKPEVYLPPNHVICVLDPMMITHFELFDPDLASDQRKMTLLLKGLNSMISLCACSLPAALDVATSPPHLLRISKVLGLLRRLHKLSLSHCNLQNHLHSVLSALNQPMVYLNLEDCRLTPNDLTYLNTWRPLGGLRELNLAHNDLSRCEEMLLEVLLPKMNLLTCFSIAYSSLLPSSLHRLLAKFSCDPGNWLLKVLCIQRFTPMDLEDLHYALYHSSSIPSLQCLHIFPASYAFPGASEAERCVRRQQSLMYVQTYFQQKNRSDICVD